MASIVKPPESRKTIYTALTLNLVKLEHEGFTIQRAQLEGNKFHLEVVSHGEEAISSEFEAQSHPETW